MCLRGRENGEAYTCDSACDFLILIVGSSWPSLQSTYSRSVECVARHNAGPPAPTAGGRALSLPSSFYYTYYCSRIPSVFYTRKLCISVITLIPNPVQLKVIYMTICLDTAPAEEAQKIRTYKAHTDQIHARSARCRSPLYYTRRYSAHYIINCCGPLWALDCC